MAVQIQPPAKGMTPAQYYIFLVNSGLPREQAMATVQQQYGPMKNKQDQAKDAQKNKTIQEIAAGAGMIGGYLAADKIGKYVKNKWGEWFNSETGEKVTGDALAKLNEQTQAKWNAGADSATTNASSGSVESGAPATPEVVSVKGDSAVIKTPNGETQTVPKEALNDSEFWSNVNWGQVAEGGLALAQMYGAYQSFKKGDKIGGSLNMAAGAGNLGTATGAVASGEAAGTLGGAVIPGLNIAAGAYGGYQTAKAMGDMAAGSQRTKTGVLGGAGAGAGMGAGIGTLILPGVGTAIGAGIGAAIGATAGAVGSWTGSHKGKAQVMRDQIRNVLQQNNILDENWQGTLADGSKYDFGKDGSHMKWKNIDKIAAAQPKAWNGAVPLADALATSYGFVGQKASDIAAWYAKGAVSNAGDDSSIAIQNMQHFAQQQGITFDQIKQKLDEAKADNRINQSQYDYYLGGARQLSAGVKAPSGQPNPTPIPKSPMPPQPQQPQQGGKMSIRDLLQRNMRA